MTAIRVGIIGMEIEQSWSAVAHVPALRAVPGYEIRAVCTTRQESANAAAAHYGIPQAYAGHEALVASPEIDLVVVTVKVPAHRELVAAALRAGKHVYCEWPLGNGLAEAREMADLARSLNLRTVIGLQARVSPTICYLRDLVADGYVGEVLSSSLIGTGMSWGGMIEARNAYVADQRNGATMLAIPIGHTLDAVCSVLGELQQVSSIMGNGRTQTTVIETGETIPMTTPDQVALVARTRKGAVLSAHYRGGMDAGTGLLWEIHGTGGTLRVTGPGGHAQLVDLALEGTDDPRAPLKPLTVPESYYHTELRQGVALNVAEMYHRFARDLREGSRSCPDFDHGVIRHEMLDAIEAGQRAAATVG